MTTEARPAVRMSAIQRKKNDLDGIRPSIPLAVAVMERLERRFFSEIALTGQENLDGIREALADGKKIIFVSNHMSHADGPAVYAGFMWNNYSDLAEKLVFLAGIRMDKLPTTGFLQRRAHTIQVWPPTERPKTKKQEKKRREMNFRSIRGAISVLQSGRILDIFPQSTRSKTKAMEKAYGEVAGYLTLFPDTLILPIAISGTEIVLPRKRLIPRKGKVGLNVGSLFDVKSLDESIPKDITRQERGQKLIDLVMGKIAALLPQDYRGYYAVPR